MRRCIRLLALSKEQALKCIQDQYDQISNSSFSVTAAKPNKSTLHYAVSTFLAASVPVAESNGFPATPQGVLQLNSALLQTAATHTELKEKMSQPFTLALEKAFGLPLPELLASATASQHLMPALSHDGTYNWEGDLSSDLHPQLKRSFDKNGFVILRNFFSAEEMAAVDTAIEHGGLKENAVLDDDGKSRMVLWKNAGEDTLGTIARCNKVVDLMETLLGDEVYHYHGKLMLKEPHTGGASVWRQDYGHWYQNGCLRPDMATMFVAVDRADYTNGGLQVVPGSHKFGRIEHVTVGGQMGAQANRMNEILIRHPPLTTALNRGDTLVFHSNTLHKSNANDSPNRRYALLYAFCTKTNNPTKLHHCPQYTPLNRVPDAAIIGSNPEMEQSNFMRIEEDSTTQGEAQGEQVE